jgi:hypothetical protein
VFQAHLLLVIADIVRPRDARGLAAAEQQWDEAVQPRALAALNRLEEARQDMDMLRQLVPGLTTSQVRARASRSRKRWNGGSAPSQGRAAGVTFGHVS